MDLTVSGSFLKDCDLTNIRENEVTGDKSLATCKELNITVPRLITNSYWTRCQPASIAATAATAPTDELDSEPSDTHSFNYVDHWPSFKPLVLGKPTPVASCPANLHMVLWLPPPPPPATDVSAGVGADVGLSNTVIRIRMIDKGYSHLFKPFMHPDNTILPHHFAFDRSAFDPQTQADTASSVAYVEVVLRPGNYLFVPSTALFSMRAEHLKDDEGTQGDVRADAGNAYGAPLGVFCSCLLDASNLQSVRSALRLEALVSPSTRALLQQLTSPSFDTLMDRNAKDLLMTVGSYHSLTKLTLSHASESKVTSEEGMKTTKSRKKNKSASYRDWQEQNKWNLLVSSLTMPQPPRPDVISTGRRSVTLDWTSPYRPKDKDTTKFGFNATVCPASSGAGSVPSTLQDRSPSPSTATDTDAAAGKPVEEGECITIEFERHSMTARDVASVVDAATPGLAFTAEVTGLEPNTPYILRIVMFYGMASSLPSDWTGTVSTQPRVSPSSTVGPLNATSGTDMIGIGVDATVATLQFEPPADDGGDDILGYHIYARHVSSTSNGAVALPTHWRWLGTSNHRESSVERKAVHKLLVLNLLPKSNYQFKVAAYNGIGHGPASVTSNVVSTGSHLLAERHKPGQYANEVTESLFGRGHEKHFSSASGLPDHAHEQHHAHRDLSGDFVTVVTASDSGSGSEEVQASSMVLVVDDARQRVHIADPSLSEAQSADLATAAWACHWSPYSFTVHAQAVWADPPMAHETLRNGPALLSRIAVVERGVVPIVLKVRRVQAAGALAVLVIDDGACRAFDQQCMPGADKRRGERFAVIDVAEPWLDVRIPVLLLLRRDAALLFSRAALPSPQLSHLIPATIPDEIEAAVGEGSSRMMGALDGGRKEDKEL